MPTQQKNRYTALDTLRGICLISMILYHAMWDIVYMFGVRAPWYASYAGFLWQQSICWGFILLSGFCFDLGKKKLKRALTVLLCSLVISAVTAFIPGAEIRFGVLCLLGSAMLFMIPLQKLLRRVNEWAGLAVSFLLFAFTKNIDLGYLGIFSLKLLTLPRFLYANYLTAFLGFPPRGFVSADYFGVFPWLFLFICGYFIFRIFTRHDLTKILHSLPITPLMWLGKNSLWVYMAHQPIIYGVLCVVFELI